MSEWEVLTVVRVVSLLILGVLLLPKGSGLVEYALLYGALLGVAWAAVAEDRQRRRG